MGTTNKEAYYAQKRNKRILLIVIIVLVVAAVIFGAFKAFQRSGKKIVSVGSKNYTEQLILGNMLADIIEENTDYEVDRKLSLGGTQPCLEALKAGEIDVYVDYASTLYVNALKKDVGPFTGEEVYAVLEEEMPKEFGIIPVGDLGFSEPYELTTKREFAEEHNLESIEDLIPMQDDIILAPSTEFANREDGLLGIEKHYGIEFGEVMPMEAGLRYTALESGEANVIVTFATDGMKIGLDLFTLDDPKGVFMPMEAIMFFNEESAGEHPEVVQAVQLLQDQINFEEMMDMNYRVDSGEAEPETVAREFLISKGLIEKK